MTSEEPAPRAARPRRASLRATGGARRSPAPDITARWLARTLVAVVVALGLFAVVALIARASTTNDAEVIGAARLTWSPGTDDPLGEGKAASVEIIEEDGRHRAFFFDFVALRPLAGSEFIEAWLVPADGAARVSIGEFDEVRTRLFSLDEGIDPRSFESVELSLQDEDNRGDYSGRSLLGGALVWLVDPPD